MQRKNDRVTSALEILASLLYMGVAWLAWNSVSQSTVGVLAPVLWGVAVVTSANLLFLGIAGLIKGWSGRMMTEAEWCIRIAGAALFAISAGYTSLGVLPLQGGVGFPGGSLDWVIYVLVGFALGWLGLMRREFQG